MKFVDSHCHFDFAAFDNDRESMWRECNDLGIQQLIIPGVSPEQWKTAVSICGTHKNIYHGTGIHPEWIDKNLGINELAGYLNTIRQQLEQHIRQKNCVAIGECGLDSFIETPMELQQQILNVHLQLAQDSSIPLIIHCRKSHNELFDQLKKYRLAAGGVIHAFSGSAELAERYWKMGFRLGIGGTITYERAGKTRDAVKRLPLESMLLETDAPDMPLCGEQGDRNSPKNIIRIAQEIADLRKESLENIATQTTINSHVLFKIQA